MKEFLADMWRAYGPWIINAILVAVGVIGGWVILPYWRHIGVGAQLFIITVVAIIAFRYITKGRKVNKEKLEQAGELDYEFCWAALRWIVVAALLLMMAADMANLVVKTFRQIGH